MTASITPVEADVFTAARSFLLSILASDVEVIRAQINRVPSPRGPNYVVMNSVGRQQFETPSLNWDPTATAPTTVTILDPAGVDVQFDFHGPNGVDNAWMAISLLRSPYGVQSFAAQPSAVVPLYASDPKQIPFVDGEQQTEDRWVVTATFQINAVTTVPQDFANRAAVGVIDVDATYPP